MTSISSSEIARPKLWQEFEEGIFVLFRSILRDPHTQQNGRPGQQQDGVDIFGRRGGPDGLYVGIQCKKKDYNSNKKVTEKELREEVQKAKDFKPTLSEFILATTAPDDKAIQEIARRITEENKAAGRSLSVMVLGWDSLQREIVRCPEALA